MAAAFLGMSPTEVTGRGAGLSDEGLARKVEAHNRMIERTYALEQDVAVLKNDVVTLYHKAGDK